MKMKIKQKMAVKMRLQKVLSVLLLHMSSSTAEEAASSSSSSSSKPNTTSTCKHSAASNAGPMTAVPDDHFFIL
jgi:hypothetical protein